MLWAEILGAYLIIGLLIAIYWVIVNIKNDNYSYDHEPGTPKSELFVNRAVDFLVWVFIYPVWIIKYIWGLNK